MRKAISFEVEDNGLFKNSLVSYCDKFNFASVYDSCNHYHTQQSKVAYHSFELLAGFDAVEVISGDLKKLEDYRVDNKDWLMGYFSYDVKNSIEQLYSVNHDGLALPILLFYQPRYVLTLQNDVWTIEYLADMDTEETSLRFVRNIVELQCENKPVEAVSFCARVSKEQYCRAVESILSHIHKGDIYELNYCIEFYATETKIEPSNIFKNLIDVSPTPFSVYFKSKDKYVLSASPERYIKKAGQKIISQPIKGTASRGKTKEEDLFLKEELRACVKEQSENIMIADLVRNDLSRVAARGSVKVEELCGIYPFRQVYQQITTIVAELDHGKSEMDVIKASFPMGSMTGAPKVRAMKLIEKYEETKRGIYSGAVGYFTPDGDFDFNVIIRSLLYNAHTGYLSYMVGSAITEKSIAENEYQECLLKAKAILQVFNPTLKEK